jgi:pilus assembly protein CpaC
MPTDSFGPVNRGELYLNGNMEGHPVKPAPATAPAAPAAPAANPAPASTAPSSEATPPAEPATPPTQAQPAPTAVSSVRVRDTRHFVASGERPFSN